MDRESILRDLDIFAPDNWSKFAVKIPMTAVVAPDNTATKNTTPLIDTKNTVAPASITDTAPEYYIKKLTSRGFTSVVFQDDKSTIDYIGQCGHFNSVNVREIDAAACSTCSYSVKFANLVREELEKVIGAKLNLVNGAKQITLYSTRDNKIKLVCNKDKSTKPAIEKDGDITTYIIGPNMISAEKIKHTIRDLINPRGITKQRFQKTKLPVSDDMLDRLKTVKNGDAVVSDDLYIENCLPNIILPNI